MEAWNYKRDWNHGYLGKKKTDDRGNWRRIMEIAKTHSNLWRRQDGIEKWKKGKMWFEKLKKLCESYRYPYNISALMKSLLNFLFDWPKRLFSDI